jgi:hypothetical protein
VADAGWYPDAMNEGWQAYYDGQRWTGDRRPVNAGPPGAPGQGAQQPSQPEPAQPQQPQQQAPHQEPSPPPAAWGAPAARPDQYPTQQWQAPPPPPQYGAQPTAQFPAAQGQWGQQPGLQPPGLQPPGPQWQDPPPPRRRNRKPLLIAGAVVVLLVAGLITWLAWPDDQAPQYTYDGKEIASAASVLSKGEDGVAAIVKQRHGASNGDTRCYFAQPKKAASGAKKSDVAHQLTCGPVLFVDGDKTRTYVDLPLRSSTSGSKVDLDPATSLASLDPHAVSADVKLTRPDGKTVPAGSGGLSVPKPPAATADTLTAAPLGPTPSPKSLTDAVIVGKTTKVTLTAAGPIDRYGTGDQARSAASGQQLIAFQVTYGGGDVTSSATARAALQASGGSPHPLPQTSGANDWIVASVPSSGSAQLVLSDSGFTQSLALPSGKPGASNIAVLRRAHRTALLLKSFNVPVRISRGSASANLTFKGSATLAALNFWAPRHDSVHASSPGKALLSANLIYRDPKSSSPSKTYGFYTQIVRLRLSSGQIVKARNIASGGQIQNVFEVPANFTSGHIEITGSTKVGSITLRVRKTVSLAVSIPAG